MAETEVAPTQEGFSDDAWMQGVSEPVLGPAYFEGRKIAEKFMAKFEAEQFKPLIDKAADGFCERLWSDLETHLLSDVESNIQSEMWRMVDGVVLAICGGQQWALQKYALGDRHDCEKVRATIAALIPAELQDPLIADLQAENARLKADNASLRDRRY